MQVKSKLLKRGSQIPYKVFHDGGKEHYNVRIYLYAKPDTLNSIRKVEYLLHSSFRNPRRVSGVEGIGPGVGLGGQQFDVGRDVGALLLCRRGTG